MTWTFLPWQLGPARVVGNWQRGNSPPTKTARGLTKHRFMGMCLWVWLKGGFWKIMQHLNHQFGLPKEWTRNKNQMCSDLEILAGMLLVPTRLKDASLGVSKRYYMIELFIFTCQKSPWNMLIHNPCTPIWVNNKLISSSHELRINSFYIQHHQPPMLNLFWEVETWDSQIFHPRQAAFCVLSHRHHHDSP